MTHSRSQWFYGLTGLMALVTTLSGQTRVPAAEPVVIRLWEQAAPGESAGEPLPAEAEVPRNDPVKTTRITNISNPTLTLFKASAELDTGTTVIVCPGGGYNYVVVDKEGTDVIRWLNSIGVSGALLKYRTPVRKNRARHEAPLQDAQRAIRLLRHRAGELGLKPQRIGIMGFSAGGHLAACASTNFAKPTGPALDKIDQVSPRPDFSILMYPAYLASKDGKLSTELPVSKDTPHSFVMMTQDDSLGVESAVAYYLALKAAQVPAELHLYPSGGHGYGMRLEPAHTASTWPARAQDWLRADGWLTRP